MRRSTKKRRDEDSSKEREQRSTTDHRDIKTIMMSGGEPEHGQKDGEQQ